jgi:hypothetical protein
MSWRTISFLVSSLTWAAGAVVVWHLLKPMPYLGWWLMLAGTAIAAAVPWHLRWMKQRR